MSKFTKAAIMQSFMKLLNEMPFDRITIKDIVDDCGINRNTFYYNFSDIYALVDEIFQSEIDNIVEKHRNYSSWTDGLLYAADFAIKNKKALYHLYNSSKRVVLEKYLQKIIFNVVGSFVKKEADEISSDICSEDINFISDFYTCALVGLSEKWLDSGMKNDFKFVIDKTGILFDINIKQAIRTMADPEHNIHKS